MADRAGGAGQVEVVVDVTVGTLPRWDGMSTSERKACRAVIEVCIEPGVGAVAEGAVGGEPCGSVVRIRG